MMAVLGLIAGAGFGAGVWMLVGFVSPVPPPIDTISQHLRRPIVSSTCVPQPLRARLLQQLVPSVAERIGQVMPSFETDLAMLRRPVESHVASTTGGVTIGVVVGVLTVAALPAIAALAVVIVGAGVGFAVPQVALHQRAAHARRSFRHALGAYLDLMVLLVAANEGTESAMYLAAEAGDGQPFNELKRALRESRMSGRPLWEGLDRLGSEFAIIELREIASTALLAGLEGAPVRRALVAKARSMRTHALSADEADARQRSKQMVLPLIFMAIGFLVFCVYPALASISAS